MFRGKTSFHLAIAAAACFGNSLTTKADAQSLGRCLEQPAFRTCISKKIDCENAMKVTFSHTDRIGFMGRSLTFDEFKALVQKTDLLPSHKFFEVNTSAHVNTTTYLAAITLFETLGIKPEFRVWIHLDQPCG